MNWQALWKTWLQKDIRKVLVFPLIVGVIIFPLGIFAGGLSKLTDVLCNEDGIAYIGRSYCGLDNHSWISPQKIISGWTPPVVVSIWQNAVMPNLIYFLVQVSSVRSRVCQWWSTCHLLTVNGADAGAGFLHILERA